MRLYISGPMTGYPHFNHFAFDAARSQLIAWGHEPIDPSRHPVVATNTWADYMRTDLRDLLDAEGVAVLDGWECSRGAVLEVHVAHALGMTVLPVERWKL